MYCPSCRSEFREGITWCANCDVELVNEVAADDPFRTPDTMADYLRGRELQVLVTGDQTLLQECQRKLAKLQIATTLATVPPEYPMQHHFRLVCSSEDYARAREVFSADWEAAVAAEGLEKANLESEDCPACGTEVPAEAEECPDCGLYVGQAED